MSRYKAYGEYRDSSLAWFGDIPNDWQVAYSKAVFAERNEKAAPHDEQLTASQKHGILPQKLFMEIEQQKVVQVFKGHEILKRVEAEDFVISMRSFQGGIEYSPFSGSISSAYVPLFAKKNISKKYYKYFFKSEPYIQALQSTTNLVRDGQALRYGNFIQVPLPIFPFEEQENIGNFLDHETARIDTLIAKQQELIKLLKEKRQAVISHAVTKGLNPNAPMRDSGVEWLGEVPAHWVVAQLKFNTLEMQTGPFGSQLHAEDYVEDGIPLVNPAHMIEGKIVPDSRVTVDRKTWERLNRHQLNIGEIIFARRGDLGRCAIVTEEQKGWLCGTGSLKAKLNKRLVPEYSYLLITSNGVISELSLESKGSTMENLNTDTLGRVRLPVPPVQEQVEILAYVNDVSGKFKTIIANATEAIGLMQERRTALISAAVTGKIDVRDWRAPVSAEVAA